MEAKLKEKFIIHDVCERELDIGVTILVLSENKDQTHYNAFLENFLFEIPKESVVLSDIQCYYKVASAKDAECILAQSPLHQTFILRNHELDSQQFVLSMKWSQSCTQHLDIHMNKDGQFFVWNKEFFSLNELVKFYTSNHSKLPDPRSQNANQITRSLFRCGCIACTRCIFQPQNLSFGINSAGTKSETFSKPYFAVIGSDVILKQISVLEDNVLLNIVTSETALDQVRRQDLSTHIKLQKILGNSRRQCFIFPDKKLRNTLIIPKSGGSIREILQDSIRSIAKWYNIHLSAQKLDIKAILVTEDQDNIRKAAEEGIPVATTEEYILSFENAGFLLDKLSKNVPLDEFDDYSFYGKLIFLQADAENCHLKMNMIKNIILEKLPLIASIHYPFSKNFKSDKVQKFFADKYIISYGNTIKDTDMSLSLILVRKIYRGDYINTPTFVGDPSFNYTPCRSASYKNITAVSYSSSTRPGTNYCDDMKNLRNATFKNSDPLVVFLSLRKVKTEEVPEFITKPNEIFVNTFNLKPLLAADECPAGKVDTKHYIFVNNWMSQKFIFDTIHIEKRDEIFMKFVTLKPNSY